MQAATAEYQVILSSESEPKELCNASMFNLQGSLALALQTTAVNGPYTGEKEEVICEERLNKQSLIP